jgi:hypothetical protein
MDRHILLVITILCLVSYSFGFAQPKPKQRPSGSTNEIYSEEFDKARKFPFQDHELRGRLDQLAQLSDEELKAHLEKWPRYKEMTLAEQSRFLMKIAEFRERRKKQAEMKAKELGLQLTPEEQKEFEKRYWEKRLEMEQQIFQELEPRRKELERQLNELLKTEFGT